MLYSVAFYFERCPFIAFTEMLFKSKPSVCTDVFCRSPTGHNTRKKKIVGEWTMKMIMRSKKSVRNSKIDFFHLWFRIGKQNKKVFLLLLYNDIIRYSFELFCVVQI